MTETTTAVPRTDVITTAHKRALRNADRIVFRLYDGQATIEAYRDADKSSTGYEQKVTIDCGGPRILDHGRTHIYVPESEWHRYSGFHMEGSYQYGSDVLHTLVDRISIGGTVSLIWDRNGYQNDITREAGIVVDHLRMVVHRANAKPNTKPDQYLVDVQTGLDNSARMVKLDWNGV